MGDLLRLRLRLAAGPARQRDAELGLEAGEHGQRDLVAADVLRLGRRLLHARGHVQL